MRRFFDFNFFRFGQWNFYELLGLLRVLTMEHSKLETVGSGFQSGIQSGYQWGRNPKRLRALGQPLVASESYGVGENPDSMHLFCG